MQLQPSSTTPARPNLGRLSFWSPASILTAGGAALSREAFSPGATEALPSLSLFLMPASSNPTISPKVPLSSPGKLKDLMESAVRWRAVTCQKNACRRDPTPTLTTEPCFSTTHNESRKQFFIHSYQVLQIHTDCIPWLILSFRNSQGSAEF